MYYCCDYVEMTTQSISYFPEIIISIYSCDNHEEKHKTILTEIFLQILRKVNMTFEMLYDHLKTNVSI